MKKQRTEQRHIQNAFCVDVSRIDHERVRFTIDGATTTGRRIMVKVDARWSGWSCIANKFTKAWTEERGFRINSINAIDNKLPKVLPPTQ